MEFSLRYDMRSFGTPVADLYPAAIEQAQWADAMGFSTIYVGEHHGADDNYIPSPMLLASAFASRTRQIRLHLSALLVPLHHPLNLAEDVAVLDLVSGGRVEVTTGLGYRPHEYRMFGVAHEHRARVFEESIEAMKRAWSGEEFVWKGRVVKVTPRPFQRPHPPIFFGGNTPAAARRAARFGVGFRPPVPALFDVYRAELEALGLPASVPPLDVAAVVFVAERPDEAWAQIGPYIRDSLNAYARWATERTAGVSPVASTLLTLESLRHDQSRYKILTPDECIDLAKGLAPSQEIQMEPLIGGLPPEISWRSLTLFEREVAPELRRLGLLKEPPA